MNGQTFSPNPRKWGKSHHHALKSDYFKSENLQITLFGYVRKLCWQISNYFTLSRSPTSSLCTLSDNSAHCTGHPAPRMPCRKRLSSGWTIACATLPAPSLMALSVATAFWRKERSVTAVCPRWGVRWDQDTLNGHDDHCNFTYVYRAQWSHGENELVGGGGGERVRREWQDDTNMYVYTKITPETNLYADAERTQLETCTG